APGIHSIGGTVVHRALPARTQADPLAVRGADLPLRIAPAQPFAAVHDARRRVDRAFGRGRRCGDDGPGLPGLAGRRPGTLDRGDWTRGVGRATVGSVRAGPPDAPPDVGPDRKLAPPGSWASLRRRAVHAPVCRPARAVEPPGRDAGEYPGDGGH